MNIDITYLCNHKRNKLGLKTKLFENNETLNYNISRHLYNNNNNFNSNNNTIFFHKWYIMFLNTILTLQIQCICLKLRNNSKQTSKIYSIS